MAPRAVVLVGLRGSGKTTVGRALAAHLGFGFVDADDRLAAAVGRPAGDWLAAVGEAEFRRQEAALLLPLLAGAERLVVATGGGAVTIPAVRHALADPSLFCAWLVAPDEVLLERWLAAPATRPPLTDLPAPVEIAALKRGRQAHYAAAASLVVDTSQGTVADAVARIAAALGTAGDGPKVP